MNATLICVRWLLAALLGAWLTGCGGGSSGDAAPAPPASPLRLDTSKSVTQTIGPAGGSIGTTAADGTAYTLTVPPKALRSATAITLAPIASIADLPSGATLAGGAHLTPEGQAFDSPVTLTIALPRPPSRALIPFTYASQLEQRRLYPATFAGSTIEFKIVHFSGYAALLAQPDTADIIDPNVTYFPTPTAAGDQALQALVSASIGLQGQARVAAMQAALRGWLDNVIKPMVVATQSITMIGVVPGSANYAASETTLRLRGEMRVFDVAAKYAFLTNAGDIGPIVLDFQVAVRDAARHVIPLFNKACDAFPAAFVLAVPELLAWQELARDSSATTLDPALERAAVLQALCIQVAYDPNGGLDFPSGIQPGQTGTLGVRAGYSINGGPVRFDEPLFVLLTGASNVSPAGLQDPLASAAGASVQQQFLWEPATPEMRIEVEACLAEELLREVCQRAFVVRGAAPPPPVGTCPIYSATVAGTTYTSSHFLTGVFAQASTDGIDASGEIDPSLSTDAVASSSARNHVSARARNSSAAATATVFYRVSVHGGADGAPHSSVVTWHGRADFEVPGSVTATLTINNDSRTDTATGTREMPLEIPVTVRHGDILKITVAVSAAIGSWAAYDTTSVSGQVGGGVSGGGFAIEPVHCLP